MGQVHSRKRYDVSQIAVEDLAPLIDRLERALRNKAVSRIIIENAPYADLHLTLLQARAMLTELKERFYSVMN